MEMFQLFFKILSPILYYISLAFTVLIFLRLNLLIMTSKTQIYSYFDWKFNICQISQAFQLLMQACNNNRLSTAIKDSSLVGRALEAILLIVTWMTIVHPWCYKQFLSHFPILFLSVLYCPLNCKYQFTSNSRKHAINYRGCGRKPVEGYGIEN